MYYVHIMKRNTLLPNTLRSCSSTAQFFQTRSLNYLLSPSQIVLFYYVCMQLHKYVRRSKKFGEPTKIWKLQKSCDLIIGHHLQIICYVDTLTSKYKYIRLNVWNSSWIIYKTNKQILLCIVKVYQLNPRNLYIL
jgi:hypothetical protein